MGDMGVDVGDVIKRCVGDMGVDVGDKGAVWLTRESMGVTWESMWVTCMRCVGEMGAVLAKCEILFPIYIF